MIATARTWRRELLTPSLEFSQFVDAERAESLQFRNDVGNRLRREVLTLVVIQMTDNKCLQRQRQTLKGFRATTRCIPQTCGVGSLAPF